MYGSMLARFAGSTTHERNKRLQIRTRECSLRASSRGLGGGGGGEKELLLSSSPPPSRQESLLVGYRECNLFALLNSTTILNWTVIMTSTPLVYTQTVHLRTALTCHVLSAYVLAPGFKPFTVRLFSWLRCLR